MLRRLVLVFILIGLVDYAWLQGILIMINSTVFILITVGIKPYKEKSLLRTEVCNELVVLIAAHINLNFLLQASGESEKILDKLKDNLAIALMGLMMFNIMVNVFFVSVQSLKDIFSSIRVLGNKLSSKID
jgi:hypothetical protein